MEDDYLTPTERELDDVFVQWVDGEDLDRNQTAYVDIYWVLGVISNGGIHGFWEGLSDQADRIIASFRMAGEQKFADMLDRSRFLVQAELDDEGFYRMNEKETELVSIAEDFILDDSFKERLVGFLRRITNEV